MLNESKTVTLNAIHNRTAGVQRQGDRPIVVIDATPTWWTVCLPDLLLRVQAAVFEQCETKSIEIGIAGVVVVALDTAEKPGRGSAFELKKKVCAIVEAVPDQDPDFWAKWVERHA